ncbi:MAG: ABC transporter substrate-binding protein [Rhodospirillaceae bacterium]
MRTGHCTSTVLAALVDCLIIFVACSTPMSAHAAERVYRIGFLGQTSAADLTRQTAALREGLRASGYEEGRNLVMEYRWAERKLDRLPALAAELAHQNVDAIVTHGSAGSRAAKQATATIPIVIAVIGDPVAAGVVASLSRPGGNVTGLVLQEFESTVKWLELLKEAIPGVFRIGWLDVPGIEQSDVAEAQARKEDGAARALGLQVQRVVVRSASDLPAAFEGLARDRVDAVVVPNTSLLNPLGGQIAALATTHRLPTVGSSLFARAGGLLAYGPDGADMYRRAAGYVDAILKGATAGDLPMEGPPKFELTVNLKTAQVLGVTLPAALVARADHRIE